MIKRVFDIVFSSLVLLLLSLPIVVSLFIVRLLGGREPFFLHERVGKGGRVIRVLKFRTMRLDAAEALAEYLNENPQAKAEWESAQKLRHDPRVTRIGRFLRRTSIDELPQFINVLLGSMSIVGPRPVTREELKKYGRSARCYMAVKPGLTGIWQISGRSSVDYNRRVAMDRYYVANNSVREDLVIVCKTVTALIGSKDAY